ncbi:LysM domain-containing protein [Colletotrichum sojae]|uniref:LysM domain-containing protein n=1 Tax=Colletotrichum sojae TaxID=2175907 RepID=A0A8H6ILW1_9PEZI|nr:LysM domain-containing protein [Colletotrichum sojae]
MRSTLVLLAAASLAAAARTSRRHPHGHVRRQTGPVAPGTAPDCTYYDTANPSVGADCSGIIVGNSYCVEDGLAADCTDFYFAVAGDSCAKIWNPAVGTSCSGLWANTYYCVGVAGTPTKPTTTAPPAPPPTAPAGPSRTQDGIADNCQRHHKAVSGDTCQGIVDRYGTFSLTQFYAWNPAVGNTCSGLWLGYYYCIGVPGTPGSPPTTTAAPAPAPPPADTCNPSAPAPTQPSATCGCKRWHLVGSGNTCDAIARQYGIAVGSLTSWNPSVGSTCNSLWLGYYVCVAK